jgi:ABC-type multidrug transport system fused ATPase/permease subunit
VIDKGTIVDFGSPKELAGRPGVYSDLLKYQVQGNKKLLAQYEIY